MIIKDESGDGSGMGVDPNAEPTIMSVSVFNDGRPSISPTCPMGRSSACRMNRMSSQLTDPSIRGRFSQST
jgi:hypothetical protein